MKAIFFEPIGGASGDMILGALLDLGASAERIIDTLKAAGVQGFSLSFERAGEPHGIQYGRCHIATEPQHEHRHLKDLLQIVECADVKPRVRERATAIFTRLAEAEAAVHDMPVEKVHFHEVGAVDTIVDVLGACIALEELGVDAVYCSELKTGKGSITCSHGTLPVPVPAVAQMIAGHWVEPLDIEAELTTPTGAAILTTLTEGNWRGKPHRLLRIGSGHGQRELQKVPNIIRAAWVELETDSVGETIEILETDIDDQSPELTAMLCDTLRDTGALDVTLTQIIMKKGRPGVRLTVLARTEQVAELTKLILTHSSTIGIRQHQCRRRVLKRGATNLSTPYGDVKAKTVERPNGTDVIPEAEACRELADKSGVSPKEIMDAAKAAARALKPVTQTITGDTRTV